MTFLLAILAQFAIAQQLQKCPNGEPFVNCLVQPCQNKACAAATATVHCQDNYCGSCQCLCPTGFVMNAEGACIEDCETSNLVNCLVSPCQGKVCQTESGDGACHDNYCGSCKCECFDGSAPNANGVCAPKLALDKCAMTACPQDLCPDGKGRRPNADKSNCCSCESDGGDGDAPCLMVSVCDGKGVQQNQECCQASCEKQGYQTATIGSGNECNKCTCTNPTNPPTNCDNAVCTADICPDGKARRPNADLSDCCSCVEPAKPNPKSCDSAACPEDLCPDGGARRPNADGSNCCSCDKATVSPCPKECAECPDGHTASPTGCCECMPVACDDGCPEDLCPDGQPRRIVGTDCCSCEAASTPPCASDCAQCPEGQTLSATGCCECVPKACADAACPEDLCPDGKPRRVVGSECCSCETTDCTATPCQEDVCPDGKARRPVGSDCCSCSEPTDPCADASCTEDLCPDGSARAPNADKSDCCACGVTDDNAATHTIVSALVATLALIATQ